MECERGAEGKEMGEREGAVVPGTRRSGWRKRAYVLGRSVG